MPRSGALTATKGHTEHRSAVKRDVKRAALLSQIQTQTIHNVFVLVWTLLFS